LARALWEVGEISEAMDHYGRLIKSGAKSADVTQDLERYAQERPDGPRVLRTLGDAYNESALGNPWSCPEYNKTG